MSGILFFIFASCELLTCMHAKLCFAQDGIQTHTTKRYGRHYIALLCPLAVKVKISMCVNFHALHILNYFACIYICHCEIPYISFNVDSLIISF